MDGSRELLTGLSSDELVALADGVLAPSAQHRLDDLLNRNAEAELAPPEVLELDALLAKVDQLNILKTRARFTLRQQSAGAGGN